MRTILAILAALAIATAARAETEALVTDTNNFVISQRAGALEFSNDIQIGGGAFLNGSGIFYVDANGAGVNFEEGRMIGAYGSALFDWSASNNLTLNVPLSWDNTSNAAATRTNLGLGATNTPTFAGLTLTTLADTNGPNLVLASTNGTLTTGSVPSGAAALGAVAQADGSGGSVFDPSLAFYNSLSGTNWERGVMRWSANVLQIGTETNGTATTRNLSLIAGVASVTLQPTGGNAGVYFAPNGVTHHRLFAGGYVTRAANVIGWAPSTDVGGNADTELRRDGAQGAVAISGTNTAANVRVYQSGVLTTNFTRLAVGWDSTNAILRPESGGTNPARVLHISGLPATNTGLASGILWNSNGTVVVNP